MERRAARARSFLFSRSIAYHHAILPIDFHTDTPLLSPCLVILHRSILLKIMMEVI